MEGVSRLRHWRTAGWKTGRDPRASRLGCFLPDLTRWANGNVRASLPPPISDGWRGDASAFDIPPPAGKTMAVFHRFRKCSWAPP